MLVKPEFFCKLAVVASLLATGVTATNDFRLSEQQRKQIYGVGGLVAAGLLLTSRQLSGLVGSRLQKQTDNSALTSLSEAPLLDIALSQQKHPHVMVVGKTGSGKSTLTEYLAALCTGKRFVVAPHFDATKDEWVGCNGIFAGGRNYGNDGDPPITYDDLINNRLEAPTASQIIAAIAAEMDYRYKQHTIPQASWEVHNWIIDETPAVARALDKYFGQQLAPILFESRKVGLRLFIISQTDNVETLKIKGQGKLREQFTYIYLGNSATARLRQLKKRQPSAGGQRWCVVDSEVALIPDASDMLPTLQQAKSEVSGSRFVASFPESSPVLPKPSDLMKRDPTDAEKDLLAEAIHDLLQTDPTATTAAIARKLGYSGKYYSRGKALVAQAVRKLT